MSVDRWTTESQQRGRGKAGAIRRGGLGPRRWACLCVLFVLGWHGAPADAASAGYAPQPLAAALEAFARASGYQLVYRAELTQGLVSRGATANLNAAETLRELLRDTGLSFTFLDGRTVAIFRSAAASDRAASPAKSGAALPTQPSQTTAAPGASPNASTAAESGHRSLISRLADLFAPTSLTQDGWTAVNGSANAAGASLDEIVVTAERFAVDVMHAPVSMTALNGDTVQRDEIRSLQELQFYVPGMTFSNTNGNATLNIRGIGLIFNQPVISAGVPLYRDGLLVPQSIADEPLWDVGNLQVLRGPQGTLVGASATGGAMFINTVNPKLEDDSGYMEVQAGTYEHVLAQGAVNLPITPTFAARVGGYFERRDSYSENLTAAGFNPAAGILNFRDRRTPGDLNMTALRGTLLWQPSDRLSVIAKVDFFQNLAGGVAQKPAYIAETAENGATTPCPPPGSYFNADASTWAQVPGTCGFAAFAPANPYQLAYAGSNGMNDELGWRESLDAQLQLWNTGPTLQVRGGDAYYHSQNSSESTAAPFFTGGTVNDTREHTQTLEINVRSPSDRRLQWIVGGFGWDHPQDLTFANFNFSGGQLGVGSDPKYSQPLSGIYLDGNASETSRAVFGNVNFRLDERWKFEAGARETWDHGSDPFQPCEPKNGLTSTCVYGDANGFHHPVPVRDPVTGLATDAFVLDNNAQDFPCNSVAAFGACVDQNVGDAYDRIFTWKLAADYNVAPQSFLYAEIATGAKAGGTNSVISQFNPEKDTDYEVGWKGTTFDGRLIMQTDAFYTRYTNMQIADTSAVNGQNWIYNAGGADVYGAEFSAQAVVGGWQLATTASVTKSQFSIDHIVNADACGFDQACNNRAGSGQCLPGQPSGGNSVYGPGCFDFTTGGVTIDGRFYPWIENIRGQQLPNSPTFQANISAGYRWVVGQGILTPRLDYSYMGRQFVAVFNTPLDQAGARSNLNAKLGYEYGHWLIEAFATNLTNDVYVISLSPGATETYDAPREFELRITERW